MFWNFKRSGFTLIELLVVLAIIMLLAAILFPVFERAQANAERASCQSNMKQIALGFKQYVQDYDNRYPEVYSSPGTLTGKWVPPLDPYLKSSAIFQCPSSEAKDYSPIVTATYAINGYLHAKAESQIDAVALTILKWEHDPNEHSTEGGTDPPRTNGCGRRQYEPYGPSHIHGVDIPITNDGCPFPAPLGDNERHLEGSNFSFVDGHVKWYRPDAIKAVPTDSDPKFNIS